MAYGAHSIMTCRATIERFSAKCKIYREAFERAHKSGVETLFKRVALYAMTI
ncbi:hypothetical protein [uncultured Bacteroides sp.]|uniref:hypothetical protein n=1 Tax=uncultured Bacteroides sp. TaxID=162156 RepID=UPI00272A70B8|nr:hypothetical protein [uncultured Bacteroides sp.]